MADASDFVADVKLYAANVDEAVVAKMFKTYRLVLGKADTRYVAASDKTELERVKANFLKKKLGLTQSDAELDSAIKEVAEAMKGDRTKSRLTFYYLLAEKFGKLSVFQ